MLTDKLPILKAIKESTVLEQFPKVVELFVSCLSALFYSSYFVSVYTMYHICIHITARLSSLYGSRVRSYFW